MLLAQEARVPASYGARPSSGGASPAHDRTTSGSCANDSQGQVGVVRTDVVGGPLSLLAVPAGDVDAEGQRSGRGHARVRRVEASVEQAARDQASNLGGDRPTQLKDLRPVCLAQRLRARN
jgi:hypothetical protein